MPRGIPKKVNDHGKPVRVARAAERRAKRPAAIDADQFYSLEEAAAFRDQCRASLFKDVQAGRIKAVVRGKRRIVLGAEIIRANRAEAGITDERRSA